MANSPSRSLAAVLTAIGTTAGNDVLPFDPTFTGGVFVAAGN
jgi:hypothetical protein